MMGCRPMETLERTTASSPRLAVTPPSSRSLHNSMRRAPPCCAARAEATESTHTSMSTGSVIVTIHYVQRPVFRHASSYSDLACRRRGKQFCFQILPEASASEQIRDLRPVPVLSLVTPTGQANLRG